MSDNSGFSAQPVTGTAIGYRWWDLFLNGGGPRPGGSPQSSGPLRGMGGLAQGTNQAVCLASGQFSMFSIMPDSVYSDLHTAPGPSCHCGYWAFWDKPFYWRTVPEVNSSSS